MEKQYLVRSANGNSKERIFDTEEEAVNCARKMNKTRKTPVTIWYGYIDQNGAVTDPSQIRYMKPQ